MIDPLGVSWQRHASVDCDTAADGVQLPEETYMPQTEL